MKLKGISLFVIIALLSASAFAADIRLDTDDIEKWHSIYLGEYSENPIEWLVLDAKKNSMGTDGMFLITKNGLDTVPVSSVKYYPSSGLKNRCASLFDSFKALEQKLVLPTNVRRINDFYLNDMFPIATEHAVENEPVFLMSAKEFNTYLKTSGHSRLDDAWYLRSNTEKWDGQMLISKYGDFNYTTGQYSFYFRPAMNINPKNAAFLSPAEGGKESSTGLFPIEEKEDVTAWKLTLIDDKRTFSASSDSVAYSDDRTLTINYTGIENEPNEYISAFLLDREDTLISYGALGRLLPESGSLSITLPDNLKNGEYTLQVFSEQRNGDKRSDYISLPSVLSFTLTDRPSIPQTDDSQSPALWFGMLAASAFGILAFIRKAKRVH